MQNVFAGFDVSRIEMEVKSADDGGIDAEIIRYVGTVGFNAVNGRVVIETVTEIGDGIVFDYDPALEIQILVSDRRAVIVALFYNGSVDGVSVFVPVTTNPSLSDGLMSSTAPLSVFTTT